MVRMKVSGQKVLCMNQRNAEEATFIPDALYFRPKIITRNTEGHYIMIVVVQEEDIAIPPKIDNRIVKYVMENLMN